MKKYVSILEAMTVGMDDDSHVAPSVGEAPDDQSSRSCEACRRHAAGWEWDGSIMNRLWSM